MNVYHFKKLKQFSKMLAQLPFPTTVYESCSFSIFLKTVDIANYLILVILISRLWYPIVVLIFISLRTNYVEHFSCAYLLSTYFLWSSVSSIFCYILKIEFFHYSCVLRVDTYFNVSLPCLANISSQSMVCFFILFSAFFKVDFKTFDED